MRLRRWLEKLSMWRTLVWFDARETVEVSTEIEKRRWNTETVKRERLLLNVRESKRSANSR